MEVRRREGDDVALGAASKVLEVHAAIEAHANDARMFQRLCEQVPERRRRDEPARIRLVVVALLFSAAPFGAHAGSQRHFADRQLSHSADLALHIDV